MSTTYKTYKTEGYIKELTVKGSNDKTLSFEPAKEWLVERENTKCTLLEEDSALEEDSVAENKYDKGLCAEVISVLKVKIESPCDQCLIKNLVAIKINKSRVRITVEADGTQFKLKSITLI